MTLMRELIPLRESDFHIKNNCSSTTCQGCDAVDGHWSVVTIDNIRRMMECRGLLPLIVAACFIGLVGSQTTLTPAVVSTTLIENVTSLTVTPVILSSTTPGCSAFNTSTCEPCAPGSQYDNNTLLCVCCSDPGLCLFPGACLACARGFYQPLAGQQQCLPCSRGSYTNFTGSPLCHPCPAGSFNNNSGAESCTSCSPGFFSSQLSSTMCTPCSRGSFCNSSGCSHCQMCPVGTEALQNAAKDCTQCRPGMHKASHQTMCQICSSGFFQIHWGQESCDVCPENHYCPSPDVNPILCPNDAFCPAGSLSPGYCMETFFRKAGDTCELAPVTIALLVIGGGATKSQDFCLTETEPQPLPMPEIIPQQEECKLEPRNEEKIKQLWEKKSEQLRRAMSKIQKDLDSKSNSIHATKPPPSNKNINCPVKLNNAAKLRQKALHICKEKEERQRKEKQREASLDIGKKAAQHKRVLAQQKKPKEKQQDLERLNQIKSSKAKTTEHGSCKMASDYGSLVKEAIALLDKFRAGKQSLDDFIEDAAKDLQNMDAQHKKFILDVVFGCTEYKKLLDVVVNVFYGQNGGSLSRGDRSQFVIICYLTTFVLDDIGLQRFSNIVKSLDIKKIHTFLNFFFTHLTTWIQKKWNSIYDAACVKEKWIGPLLRWRPDIDILMDQLVLKISRGNQVKKAPIKITKPQEFCLSKPKPRPLPMPKLIPQQEKCKPVPNSIYKAPKERQIIKEIKQENHQKTKELLNEANMKKFRCGNPQKSERTKRVMSKIQKDLDSKLQFKAFHHSEPPPSNKNINCPVKPNNAAKLRQRALHNHKKKEALQRVERLAEGGGEASSFLQWQKNMREKDLQEELAKLEQRRLEGLISHKEAEIARINIMESNQKAAQLKKEETAQLMREYAEKRLQEEKELRDLVQQVAEGHKNSKMAKEKLQKFKQSIVKEVSGQSQALLRQALEEAQAELSRKFQTFFEIRAIESLPNIRMKYFDDTKTAGHELMEEMSMIELKLRLAHLKEVQQTEQQEKREHILEEKQKKKKLDLESEIEYLRERVMVQAKTTREKERKATLDLQQKVAQEKRVLAERKKLEEERRRLEQIKSSKVKTAEKTTKVNMKSESKKKTMTAEEMCELMTKNLEKLIQRAF